MINAAEALALPSAQLSDDDVSLLSSLTMQISETIQSKMERRGLEMRLEGVTNGNVLAEINQQLKQSGWQPQWQPIVEQHPLNKTQQRVSGYILVLAPTDSAYAEYRSKLLA